MSPRVKAPSQQVDAEAFLDRDAYMTVDLGTRQSGRVVDHDGSREAMWTASPHLTGASQAASRGRYINWPSMVAEQESVSVLR